MKMPNQLKSRGQRSQRWQRWRIEQRAKVWRRCHEHCEVPGCKDPARELDHIFGRGHLIAEPLASTAAMSAGECSEHHRKRTVEPGCTEDLQLMHIAILRGWKLAGAEWFSDTLLKREEYVGEARQIETFMREQDGGSRWLALVEESGRDPGGGKR